MRMAGPAEMRPDERGPVSGSSVHSSKYGVRSASKRRAANPRGLNMASDSGPKSGAKGVVEDIKGKAKEVIGEVTGDDSKEREGRAQQDKAQSQRDVAEHEAKAEAARSEASVHEAEQRMHQDD